MGQILLTDEEILEATQIVGGIRVWGGYDPREYLPCRRQVAKAQLKKIKDMGNAYCLDSLGCIDIYKLSGFWQALLKEAGILH